MGISGGVVGLEWGNIEDAMDWFPQVFEAERAVETPQTQGSCQCPFNQVWEKPMKPPWEPLIYILEKINKKLTKGGMLTSGEVLSCIQTKW